MVRGRLVPDPSTIIHLCVGIRAFRRPAVISQPPFPKGGLLLPPCTFRRLFSACKEPVPPTLVSFDGWHRTSDSLSNPQPGLFPKRMKPVDPRGSAFPPDASVRCRGNLSLPLQLLVDRCSRVAKGRCTTCRKFRGRSTRGLQMRVLEPSVRMPSSTTNRRVEGRVVRIQRRSVVGWDRRRRRWLG